jgi:hypothetical protein
MRSRTSWIIFAVLVVLALVAFLMSYPPVGIGLAILAAALLISRLIRSNDIDSRE